MMRRLVTEVLVVGLGPAGASAAGAAARAGASVIAVERKQEIGIPVQCAEFLPRPMGQYASNGSIKVQDVGAMLTHLPSGKSELNQLGGLMINRAAFDQALAQAAAVQGAQLMLGTHIISLDTRVSRALIKRDGKLVDVRYKVLIAADGPHSCVAKLLGLKPLPTVITRQYTVALNQASQATEVWLNPNYPSGYAWLFPKGKYANLGVGLRRDGALQLRPALDQLHQSLLSKRRVGAQVLGQTGGHIPVGGLRSELRADRILFVGDAAGLAHPITGAGISAAVLSGQYAGGAAQRYVASGHESALRQYEEMVQDHFSTHLQHACKRRERLEAKLNAASTDAIFRETWIAFPEYYASRSDAYLTPAQSSAYA